ncbi:hypothetical protein GA0115239_12432 [Streptomyces sp. BpilaLS-43]|nr:hypothetical protein GA0115239_12432 [Streptomyces sp. BpilaLS-43]
MSLTAHGIPEILALGGRDLGHSGWKEVTQELIDAYAEVSGTTGGSTPTPPAPPTARTDAPSPTDACC